MDTFNAVLIALNLLMATVYVLLGRVVARRRPSGAGRLAASAFSLWWFALGLMTATSIVNLLVSAVGAWSLPAFLAYTHVLLLILIVALTALMYYMVYLFTGRRGAWIPIAAGYASYYGAIVYYLAAAQPTGLAVAGTGTRLVYGNDLTSHWSTLVLGLALVVPPLVAALAYFSLFFRVQERSQRFRIAAIGGAFIMWFGASLGVGQLTDWGGTDAWRVGSAMVALAAAWLVFVAFQPPDWLQKRFGLAGYGQH